MEENEVGDGCVVHLDNGMLCSSKKKSALKAGKTWRKLKRILLSERRQSEKATHLLIPTTSYITFWKWQTMVMIKEWLQGGVGMNGQITEVLGQ